MSGRRVVRAAVAAAIAFAAMAGPAGAQFPEWGYPWNGGEGRGALFDPAWSTPYGWMGPLATWNSAPPPGNFGEGGWASPGVYPYSVPGIVNAPRIYGWAYWSPGIRPQDAIPHAQFYGWN